MAFDQTTRNRLQKFVSRARDLLADEFTRQLQYDYGMDPDTGTISDIERLTHLDDAKHQTAVLLRDTLIHYQASSPDSDTQEILRRIVREQAFTVLNRLCALRMAEARDILMESIANGYQSKGFQLYARVSGPSQGNIGDTYRNYLFSVFDEFALDLAVLFDRYSPMGRLFPKESVLLELLDLVNDADLEHLWAEDETIGWIYQYFNSKEERKKMRDESAAPRNSRELAVRNQFFTPRYVVEFLTDNTLGRIWYEMTRGNTDLKNKCRYLVRRPNEIFLEKGEPAPDQTEDTADLTQEELLNLPVYVEHRPFKDPREILMLDPACGSMHFGLYAFDLFETIYQEAWNLQVNGQWPVGENKKFELLTETYPTREALQKDIPRLIIENNIHGIDIDPRAVQIAGLSLWLRAQRSWKEQQIPTGHRPDILKANIVCAEPMPGEKELLAVFSENLKPRVLGQLVEIIFEKMALAGEAGSLLKIEEEIEDAVEKAREAFNRELLRRRDETGYLPGMAPEGRQRGLFDFADLPDKTQFWHTAEEKILEALKTYSEQAEAEEGNIRRLFTEDAAKGFAFIDLCRKRYDVVLMNPPFGEVSNRVAEYVPCNFEHWGGNFACAFISRISQLLKTNGFNGAICDNSTAIRSSYQNFRINEYLSTIPLKTWITLGWGVLDANVETYLMTRCKKSGISHSIIIGTDYRAIDDKKNKLEIDVLSNFESFQKIKTTEIGKLPNSVIDLSWPQFLRTIFYTNKNLYESGLGLLVGHQLEADRSYRLFWEVHPLKKIGEKNNWAFAFKGGEYSPGYLPVDYIAYVGPNFSKILPKSANVLRNYHCHFSQGVCYGKRGEFVDAQPLRKTSFFTHEGLAFISEDESERAAILALMNSNLFNFGINKYCGQHKTNGYVNLFPAPNIKILIDLGIITNLTEVLRIKYFWWSTLETEYLFLEPIFLRFMAQSLKEISKTAFLAEKESESRLYKLWDQMNEIIYSSYGLNRNAIDEVKAFCKKKPKDSIRLWFEPIKGENRSLEITVELISFFIGKIFGLLGREQKEATWRPIKFDDFFDSLPIPRPCLKISPETISNFPEILADETSCPTKNIITLLRKNIEFIWKDRASDIEQEACEILGVRSLQEYFSKPAKFFADHLKRYSKSRRQAPIYWPLSTPSGSYTLWLYYHRLTDQILYTCVNNFVGPKLKQVSDDAAFLRKKSNRTKKQETELENLSDLVVELTEFQDELLRIATFWKPNLNDGVQITAAPLWKLFQYKPWQKKLKQTWKELEKGKYEWAHLAYSIWPERVIRASHKDRSIAIAHDLEDVLWEEIETGTDRQGHVKTKWVPKQLAENELKAIIQEKIRMRHHVD
jgi:hypothetical protein